MTRGRWLLVGILIVATLLSYYPVKWLVDNIESYQVETEGSVSARARRNRFLAAEMFLKRSGVSSDSVFGRGLLYELPSRDDSLVIADMGIELGEKRQQRLVDWLESGGQLLTTLRFPDETQDQRFLGREYAIHYKRIEKNVETEYFEVPFTSQSQPLNIAFDDSYRIDYDADFMAPDVVLADDHGAYLLQFQIGEGNLTVASDLDFLTNDHIDQHDHAFLLWLLANQNGKVWFMVSNQTPSLWALAWRYNPYLVTSLILFSVLFFGFLWYRLGPVQEQLNPYRRDIREHLHAVARFHLKNDLAASLLSENRQILRQQILRKHPYLKSLDKSALAVWVAQHTGLNEQAVSHALSDQAVAATQLSQTVRTLQLLKQRI